MSKKIFIMGDSYSTYRGWNPEGYLYYYSDEREVEPIVIGVEKTWWSNLAREMDYELLMNDSYSGSTICNTRYEGEYCPETSFIGRLDRYIADGYFSANNPDMFFVFGGTNDSWADAPLGELMYSDWSTDDLRKVLPAFCYLLHRITEISKGARCVVILNTELKQIIVEEYHKACEKYGAECIELIDIEKINGHPSIKGMQQISQQIQKYL